MSMALFYHRKWKNLLSNRLLVANG
jgi:hypothetical protein